MALASGILDTGVTWEIKDKLAMLLERLTGEDLREQICNSVPVPTVSVTVRTRLTPSTVPPYHVFSFA